MTQHPDDSSPWPAAAGPTYEDLPVETYLGVQCGREVRVLERQVREESSGRLVDFAVSLQARSEDEDAWVDVVRIDVAHGAVHIDRYDIQGRKTKDHDGVPIECRNDPDKAYDFALDYVYDLEGRLERWA